MWRWRHAVLHYGSSAIFAGSRPIPLYLNSCVGGCVWIFSRDFNKRRYGWSVLLDHSRSHDRSGRKMNNGIRFFSFPSWKKQQGKQVQELTKRRRIAWVAAIRRTFFTLQNTPASARVCSLHFQSGQPSFEMLDTHPDWAPTFVKVVQSKRCCVLYIPWWLVG